MFRCDLIAFHFKIMARLWSCKCDDFGFVPSCVWSVARFFDQLRSDHQVLREIHEELGPVIGHSCFSSNHPAQQVFHQFQELELELAQLCCQISISCGLADDKDVAIMKAEVPEANNYILRE